MSGETPKRGRSVIGDGLAWVRQEQAEGCAVASLAMLLERSYADVVVLLAECPYPIAPEDWDAKGTSHWHVDWALATDNAYTQRRYKSWGWEMVPFAGAHYASVVQPSGNYHVVVVRADGGVLDPLREGVFSLSDWPDVNHITGVVWA